MSADKIFTPCPMPAAENAVFCKTHVEESARLKLQAGRKMVVIPWEGQMQSLVVRGFLQEYERKKFKGGNVEFNQKMTEEWEEDMKIIMKGMDMLDRQDQFWAENSKTGKYLIINRKNSEFKYLKKLFLYSGKRGRIRKRVNGKPNL